MNKLATFSILFSCASSACIGATPGAQDELDDNAPSSSTEALRAQPSGAVFTLSNEAAGNRIFAFARDGAGMLSEPIAVASLGLGTGDSLGSQSALWLTDDHHFLLAVDAGSNTLSTFAVSGAQLSPIDRVDSGGVRPISVTERRGLVFVLNAGGTNNVTGFSLDATGHLHLAAGGSAGLSDAAVSPAQVELAHDAHELIVTEKGTHKIDVFPLNTFGRLGPRTTVDSAGTTPFGFELTRNGTLIVSEAATASMSSYAVSKRDLDLVSGVIPDTQAAPCWVALSGDDRFAYTANAGSASISSYSVAGNGEIALVHPRAGELGEGGRPLDMAVAGKGRYLYVLDRGNLSVVGFEVQADGALQPMPSAGALTPFTSGLAAY